MMLTVAIDAATGPTKGHHQHQQPNESWDWDEVSPPSVDFRAEWVNVSRPLINIGLNGHLWFLERTYGRIG